MIRIGKKEKSDKLYQAKQGETAQLTEDESTGTTEQQTEETTGDADGTRAVQDQDRKSTRLNSSHNVASRMPSSA